jgi:hypothetical protein
MSGERRFKLRAELIKQLIEPMGVCMATKHITVEDLLYAPKAT